MCFPCPAGAGGGGRAPCRQTWLPVPTPLSEHLQPATCTRVRWLKGWAEPRERRYFTAAFGSRETLSVSELKGLQLQLIVPGGNLQQTAKFVLRWEAFFVFYFIFRITITNYFSTR